MSHIDWEEFFPPPTPVTISEEEQLYNIFELSMEKKKKYDRQLRLWGPHGQSRIDKCSVLLLNATAVGCEVLKNLVLPGIGQITICDNRKVEVSDLGVNFYVAREELGKPIAEVTARILLELNPDVKGNFLSIDPREMIQRAPDAFEDYDFIIASQLDFETLTKLCDICAEKKKYLIAVRSYGMCGYIRQFGNDHVITESKLDNPVEDLRLYDAWGDLQKFADIQVLDQMNDKDHSHTPYPVILLQIVKLWKEKHQGNLPSTDEEKNEFREMIMSRARRWGVQENFMEAYNKSYQAYRYLEVPDEVIKIMNNPRAQFDNINDDTPLFWLLVYGLSMFYNNEGDKSLLPLQGKVSDMHSDTDRFVRLQSLYRRKHRADIEVVRKYIRDLCIKKGLKEPTKDEVSFFCKYGYNLRVIEYRTIRQEIENCNKEALEFPLLEKSSAAMLYFCMRAGDIYYKKHNKYPGEKQDDDLEKDSKELYEIMKDLIISGMKMDLSSSYGDEDLRKFARCWTRFGASEIHTISSLIGGVASQELIKLCTRQRLSLNNTWIYNGIDSTSVSLEL